MCRCTLLGTILWGEEGGGEGGGFTPTPINRVVEEEELQWISDYYDVDYSDFPFEAEDITWFSLSQGNPDDVRDFWNPYHNPIGPDDSPQNSFQPDSIVITGDFDGQLVPAETSNSPIYSTSYLPQLFPKGEELKYNLSSDNTYIVGYVGTLGPA